MIQSNMFVQTEQDSWIYLLSCKTISFVFFSSLKASVVITTLCSSMFTMLSSFCKKKNSFVPYFYTIDHMTCIVPHYLPGTNISTSPFFMFLLSVLVEWPISENIFYIVWTENYVIMSARYVLVNNTSWCVLIKFGFYLSIFHFFSEIMFCFYHTCLKYFDTEFVKWIKTNLLIVRRHCSPGDTDVYWDTKYFSVLNLQ